MFILILRDVQFDVVITELIDVALPGLLGWPSSINEIILALSLVGLLVMVWVLIANHPTSKWIT